MFRIGHGFDVHKFSEETGDVSIKIGGVAIPYERTLLAHSDGDVALHALCDALLGAVALGDIGHHFPDNDPAFANADSRNLLKHVWHEVKAKHYKICNIDITIMAQAPKMAPHIQAMRETIAIDLEIQIDQVNVKATTTEKLGFVGRKEGIAVEAVALLMREPN
ncbi:2-C-methyl-D-erythritol 2,4-cyclodiphosphate synthase [Bermanella marisrubri]|uniref:2-C-methyl-D-erythritol 2,4-cyclodiphosphate synthase n=1 Tax=Bermanella marisrubri TaxID=207949 RepID=Q1N1K6_9GAMM|nr:2-C-methyl-D-erythritol 2,4-cyclodiphosphate synthase [Bermanella marisrubri]EAT12044.1 2C-methyl-D-erythritol 2,4-cyclodiphosphate synthase [Oceanobacter sp. RED65] [Bermanella marisrubri]QIZ83517.1 2-C-methyl-D-erythritol 2,4-cyclodiphosphate synthase [Bermanella marisrubri]